MAGPQTKNYPPGQEIFREGEQAKAIYLIKRGSVLIKLERGAQSVELAQVRSGEVIGELAFFDRAPRSATAVAISEVELVEIGFDHLDGIYKTVPDYFKTIMTSVTERLRKSNTLIKKLQKQALGAERTSAGKDNISVEMSAAEVLAATCDVDWTHGGTKTPGEGA